jgi:ectoine hydroxylase-related dioxygenase (phytanoyl-CoA dioxygenase family)
MTLMNFGKQEMLLFKDKINYKAPHGNGFAAHQDAPAYDHIRKIEHVTLNVAVDQSTPENGCLEVVTGSHRMDIPLNPENKIIDKKWEDAQEWTQVLLQPGELKLGWALRSEL